MNRFLPRRTFLPSAAHRRLLRPSRFALVGGLGLIVNQIVFLVAYRSLGVSYLLAPIVATGFSTTFNYILLERWVFADRAAGRLALGRFGAYLALNLAINLVLRLPVLYLWTGFFGLAAELGNVVSIGVAFVFRYLVASRWIWAGRAIRAQAPDATGRYHYDVHGLIGIRSEVPLPELAAFAVPTLAVSPRLTVGTRSWLGGGLHRRAGIERRGGALHYHEQLGALGAAFTITEVDGVVRLTVNGLLRRSNHVCYTNLVEPLLRFLLADTDHVLLHGASLEAHGGLVLSARTDTGKTGTVLRLVARGQAQFLGDDMVIVAPDGRLLGFPKPLTLSSHTMAAVPRDAPLGPIERAMLAIRSRVHSREGRAIGQALARLPVPIVTLNAWLQALIPPPKYDIGALVAGRPLAAGQWRRVVVLERGPAGSEPCAGEALIDTLLANTEDAYTFPPFATLTMTLAVRGQDVAELRARERAILTAALAGVTGLRLQVPDFSWADRLAETLGLREVEPSAS